MKTDLESVLWRFFGYVTPAQGRLVQEWFDGLEVEERDEIRDVFIYLQRLPSNLWREPEFKRLDQDLSELRVKVNALKRTYRIYGCFWPEHRRHSYTLLFGKIKKTKNDERGKAETVKRLKQLRNGEASIHEFEFEERSDNQIEARSGGPQTIH